MSELRRDYFENYFTLAPMTSVAPRRYDICPFCPGHEDLLPPAEMVFTREKGGSIRKTEESEDERVMDWDIKVVNCLSPLISEGPSQIRETRIPFRKVDPVAGVHYVIIPTRRHDGRLSSMNIDDITLTLLSIQEFGKKMYQRKGVNYVLIYYEEDPDLDRHPLVHMLGLSELPPALTWEIQAHRRIVRESGACPLCVIAEAERSGPRELLSNNQFISVFPWAPSGEFEAWVMPFKHRARFFRLTHTSLNRLAEILTPTLAAMAETAGSFYMVFYTNSLKRSSMNIHWSIRLRDGGKGFEGIMLGYGIRIYKERPEDHAKNMARHARRVLAELLVDKHRRPGV